MRTLAILIFCLSTLAFAEEVEIVQLRYKTADQVIPTLRPLVSPGGAITGMQSQLIIRSDRRNIEDIKRVVGTIDTLPRRLLISVRQDAGGRASAGGVQAGGAIQGGNGRVIVGRPAPGAGSGVNVQIQNSRTAGSERITQQVQGLEGNPAFIQVGQNLPVPARTVTQTPGGAVVTDTVVYRDISTGFDVTPRVSGDRVVLEVSPRRETPGALGPGSANTQRIVTTASGRLGEWIDLGGVTQSGTQSGGGLLSSGSASRESASRVWVKVEELR